MILLSLYRKVFKNEDVNVLSHCLWSNFDSGPSFGRLTCEKAKLFLKKLSFFAGLAIVSSFGQNVKKLSFLQKA